MRPVDTGMMSAAADAARTCSPGSFAQIKPVGQGAEIAQAVTAITAFADGVLYLFGHSRKT